MRSLRWPLLGAIPYLLLLAAPATAQDAATEQYARVQRGQWKESNRWLQTQDRLLPADASLEQRRRKKELEAKNTQLASAYRELEESNRGVVSLHAELAEKAERLRHSADLRGRLVADVSHEFRTPLHTILGLDRAAVDADGLAVGIGAGRHRGGGDPDRAGCPLRPAEPPHTQ